jgi:hypothetical protein
MDVKIVQRQDNLTTYNFVVPAEYASFEVGRFGFGSVTPSSQATYNVRGATFSLLLPDGRLVVANCEGKQSFDRSRHGVPRDCKMPMTDVNEITVEFKRNTAKLFWLTSVDGKTFDHETYKILGILKKLPVSSVK